MKNNFPIMSFQTTDVNTFIKYWQTHYDYKNEDIYQRFIVKKIFDSHDIEDMFKWKNNMTLSGKKNVTVSLVINNLKLVNRLKKNFNMDLFSKTFLRMGAIWKIFLLHAIQPSEFPIYDQHVYRAFKFIKNKTTEEIPASNKLKFQIYIDDYLPFFKMIKSTTTYTDKNIDEALWAFGKMIKKYPMLTNC